MTMSNIHIKLFDHNKMSLENLTDLPLVEICLHLDLATIGNICQVHRNINNRINYSSNFWHMKFLQTFGPPSDQKELNRNLYKKYWKTRVWITGEIGQVTGESYIRYFVKPTMVPREYFKRKHYSKIVKVSAGKNFNILLDSNGYVWSIGDSPIHHLGTHKQIKRSYDEIFSKRPARIPKKYFGCRITDLDVGLNHIIFLDEFGKIWSIGKNSYGQLGLGDYESRYKPTLISKLSNIKQVSTYMDYNLALSKCGQIWEFGSLYRTAGLEKTYPMPIIETHPNYVLGSQIVEIESSKKYIFAVTNTGQVLARDRDNCNSFFRIGSKAQKISSHDHCLILNSNNSVQSLGSNIKGELGLGINDPFVDTLKPIVDVSNNFIGIAAGFNKSFIWDNCGNILSFGSNNHGELGLGHFKNKNKPNKVSLNLPDSSGKISVIDISPGANQTLILTESS